MERDPYVIRVRTEADPGEAEARVRQALQTVGFGVLTEIDVAATLKEKLGEDIPPYRILGACKPPYAHKALMLEPELGALLPCNVVVREHPEGGSELIAIDPNVMLGISGNVELAQLAGAVADELATALERAVAQG